VWLILVVLSLVRRVSVAVINILEFWAAVATAIYSGFRLVWGDGLIAAFSWDAGVCGAGHAFMHFDVGVENRFLCERDGLGGGDSSSSRMLHFLIAAVGEDVFGIFSSDQASDSRSVKVRQTMFSVGMSCLADSQRFQNLKQSFVQAARPCQG
jgi:hypothetical protein